MTYEAPYPIVASQRALAILEAIATKPVAEWHSIIVAELITAMTLGADHHLAVKAWLDDISPYRARAPSADTGGFKA